MKKRLASVFLTVCMVFQLLAAGTVTARSEEPSGAPYDFSGVMDNPNGTIPDGAYGNLTADGKFYWQTGDCGIDVQTNGYTFTLDSGDGNPFNYSGVIYGTGSVEIKSARIGLDVPVIISGSRANEYTGTTTALYGPVLLAKDAGAVSIPGDYIMKQSEQADELRFGNDEQIADTATVTVESRAGKILTGQYTETIARLVMADGARIETSAGGRLVTGSFSYGGEEIPEGTYTSSNSSYVLGDGALIVGGGETPEPGGPAGTPYDFSGAMDNPNGTIPGGAYGNLTADGKFYWQTGDCGIDVQTNGYTFTLDSGHGNPFNYSGVIYGTGSVEILSARVGLDVPVIISGSRPNLYTGTTTAVFGPVLLAKDAGVDSIPGDYIMKQSEQVDELRFGNDEQIADTATVTVESQAGKISIGQYTETVARLVMAEGARIETAAGGRLATGSFSYGGEEIPEGTYTSSNSSYVLGDGSLAVGGGEAPVVGVEGTAAAINGALTLRLNAVPTEDPSGADFTATIAIDGAEEAGLPLSDFSYDKAGKTITYTFQAVPKTDVRQSVAVTVLFKGSLFAPAPAFTVAAEGSGEPETAPVYEPFDYSSGDIVGKNGGEGFGGAWTEVIRSGTVAFLPGSLSYEGLPVSGGSMRLSVDKDSSADGTRLARNISAGVGDGLTTWYSYLVKCETYQDGGIVIFPNGNAYAGFGKGWGPSFSIYMDTGTSAVSMEAGKTYLVVAKVENGTTAYLWINPSLAEEPVPEEAQVSEHMLGMPITSGIGSITIDMQKHYGGVMVIDELRIGETWEQVTNQPAPEKAPSVPAGLKASFGEYPDTIELKWNSSTANPEGYMIYRSESDSFEAAEKIGEAEGPEYSDTAIDKEKEYFYWVKAYNAFGESGVSASARGRTAIEDRQAGMLARPVVTIEDDGLTLSWAAVEEAEKYQIYKNTVRSLKTSSKIGETSSPDFTDAGGDGESFYWVRAIKNGEQSLFSTAVSKPSGTVKIIPVGDSITWIGSSYRGALYTKLVQAGFDIDFVGRINSPSEGGSDPDCQGMNGAVTGPGNTTQWDPRFKNTIYDNVDSFMELDPDVALMLIGINDFTNYIAPDEGKNNDRKAHERLEAILRKMLENKPEMKILVSSLVPVSDARHASMYPTVNYDYYNQRVEALALKLKNEGYPVYFVDMNNECGINPNDTNELYDGLHPTVAGSLKIANVWFDHLENILNGPGEPSERVVRLAPYPKSVVPGEGSFTLTPGSKIIAQDESILPQAQVLSDEIYISTGTRLTAEAGASPDTEDIYLRLDGGYAAEKYKLEIGEGITVTGKDKYAISLGTSTLIQLLDGTLTAQRLTIEDEPDSAYRAVSVDVARRFTSIDSLKKMVELCRLNKVNYMQLHLTDDQNWMMPSEAYPALGSASGNQSGKPAYTKAELQDLEKYASDRGVAIIPEIDMPGHTSILVNTYPEIFGISNGSGGILGCMNFASGQARAATKTLIDEALAIFKSTPYYHLGGDEASYGGASADQHFKDAYTRLGLAQNDSSNEEVFRDFIVDINNYVKAKDKKLIVWEGFPRLPNAKVQVPTDIMIINWEHSYYNMNDMLQDGYTIVNGSWHPYYVCDHFPGNDYTYASPAEIYRYSKYKFGHNAPGYPGYDPVTVPRTSSVAGAMLAWWEGTEQNFIPLMRYRVAPFGAKLWNESGETDYAAFSEAAAATDALFGKLTNPVVFDADLLRPERGQFSASTSVKMESGIAGEIRYTTDGQDPTAASQPYTGPVAAESSMTVKAALFVEDRQVGLITRLDLQKVTPDTDDRNLALGKPAAAEGDIFPNNPAAMLTDGIIEPMSYWYGARNPQTVTIDLGGVQKVGEAIVYSVWNLQNIADRFNIELSTDGVAYTKVADLSQNTKPATSAGYTVKFQARDARYVRINTFRNSGGWAEGDKARIVEVKLYSEAGSEPEDNLALNKSAVISPPPSDFNIPRIGQANDGILDANNYANTAEDGNPSSLTIDLEAEKNINKVILWHYAEGNNRIYEDVIIQFSNDPEFKTGVVTVFNNDTDNSCGQGAGSDALYTENTEGTVFEFPAVKARCFRTWVNGFHTTSSQTKRPYAHWQEVEIYGAGEEVRASAAAENGKVSVVFEKELPESPDASDFQIKLSVDGGAEQTAVISEVAYDAGARTAEVFIDRVEAGGAIKNVTVQVFYKGRKLAETGFTVGTLSAGITVGTAESRKIGDVVDIPVSVANNPGITEFVFDIDYDGTKLQLISPFLEAGPAIPATASLNDNIADAARDRDRITANLMGVEDFSENGTLFTLKFKVLDSAAGINPIVLSCTSMTGTGADRHSFRPVAANVSNGGIGVDTSAPVVTGVLTVTNGRAELIFTNAPENPAAIDFTAGILIGGGAEKALELSDYAYDSGTKTATFRFSAVEAAFEDINVRVAVYYRGVRLAENSFTVGKIQDGGGQNGGGQNGNNPGTGNAGPAPALPVNAGEPEKPKIQNGQNGEIVINSTVITKPTVSNGVSTSSVDTGTIVKMLEDIKKAETENAGKTVSALIEIKSGLEAGTAVSREEIKIPAAAVAMIAGNTDASVRISTSIAEIVMDSKALEAIGKESESGGISINIALADTGALPPNVRQTAGDRPVYDFAVISGGKTISGFGGGRVDVTVPYEPGEGEDAASVVIYYINGEGELMSVPNCRFDAASGQITFSVRHFSKYMVGYNKVYFEDVKASDWFSEAVRYIAARDITKGKGNDRFGPEMFITRGEFAAILCRAFEIDQADGDNYSDAGSTYYTGCLAALRQLGIAYGTGDNKFEPDRRITREDMFALLYRTLSSINGLKSGNGKPVSSFADHAEISAPAREAMTFFAENGVIAGSGNRLRPGETATRAEAAQIFYSLLIK